MRIQYICSNLDRFDLYSATLSTSKGSFHEYKWKHNKNGKLEREPLEYKLTFQLRGTLEARKEMLDRMTDDFERDIVTNISGRFVFGEYELKGFVIESKSGSSDDFPSRSEREITIYCPSGFWVKKTKYKFDNENQTTQNTKKYTYKYPYRYAALKKTDKIINESYDSANFLSYIYGPCSNPTFYINDKKYLINSSLNIDEYIEIDTEKESIYKVLPDGKRENIFHLREKGSNFFKKIPSGVSQVTWSEGLHFEIILLAERSEPRWN